MEAQAMFLMMMTGPLIATIVTAMNAKRINAAWRERRAVRAASR
jgi:hypothetical protein